MTRPSTTADTEGAGGVGVAFPRIDGRRSTSATGRAILVDALATADPIGSIATACETSWRHGYVEHFRRALEAGLGSPDRARRIAADGLRSVHDRMVWSGRDGDEVPLARALASTAGARPILVTETLAGHGEPETELSVPYRGTRLAGDELRRQLDSWVERGIVEPSFRTAIGAVIDHPEWLRVPDRTVVVLGAGAEMGPLRSLLRWGADVAALDLPRPGLWRSLLTDTKGCAGRLRLPVRPGESDLTERAGADLVRDLPEVSTWVDSLDGPLVLGNYVYADGGTNVRVSAAVDALTLDLAARRSRSDLALAYLATPTDVFAVPREAVEASVDSYAHRRTSKVLRVPLRTLSGGRLLRRNYVPGEDPGVCDSIVTQQGPNYLLAKRIQRWRATTARPAGHVVSLHVAPPTRTRSVIKNRALAAAYAGAHRFGIEVFEPGTANTLMAALLAHDLGAGAAGGGVERHPWQDEAEAAAHGGLWRTAYDPRSALGLAALLGWAAAR